MTKLSQRILRCGVLSAVLAVAAIQARAEEISVRGARSCQAYMDAKRNSVPQAVSDLRWLLGYLSGLAVATHVDILGKDNADAMLDWVNAYCELHPANYLSEAGDLYYRFLKEQMRGSK
jgi:hypothetical protein